MDWIQASLLVALGAALFNAVDTIFNLTPAIAAWLEKLIEP
jgi:hypothetical protein